LLKGIFKPGRQEVEGGWRRLHNEELHNLYTSSNIITVIKSRRLACYVACMKEIEKYKILVGKHRGRHCSEDLDVDGKVMLEYILGKLCVVGADWIHLAKDKDQC
jgi:hypothetical protein